jgi:hypothetical protein
MKRLCLFAIFLVPLFGAPCAEALQAGGPEAALEEMATADNIETLIRHVPVKIEKFMHKLPLEQRAAMVKKLQVKQNVEREGGSITKSSDGRSWEVVEKPGGEKATFTWKKTFFSGDEALVQIEINEQHHTGLIQIGMRYEDGNWRMQEIGEWRGTDIESEFLPRVRATDVHNTSAASILRTLNTAIVTYAAMYPDVGYPKNLPALSGQESDEPTQDHALLVDNSFSQEPVVRYGYEFRYERTAQGHYQISATPTKLGEGQHSFFTDDTCVIRATAENRPANAQDPPLE